MSLKELFSQTTVNSILDFVKTTIRQLAEENGYGPDKKAELDKQVCSFIKTTIIKPIDFPGLDTLWELILNKLIDMSVPIFTQKVYDLMKDDSIIAK